MSAATMPQFGSTQGLPQDGGAPQMQEQQYPDFSSIFGGFNNSFNVPRPNTQQAPLGVEQGGTPGRPVPAAPFTPRGPGFANPGGPGVGIGSGGLPLPDGANPEDAATEGRGNWMAPPTGPGSNRMGGFLGQIPIDQQGNVLGTNQPPAGPMSNGAIRYAGLAPKPISNARNLGPIPQPAPPARPAPTPGRPLTGNFGPMRRGAGRGGLLA